MQQNFLAALRSQFAKLWDGSANPLPEGVQLEAFVLEDRLLYSATALPIDLASEAGSVSPLELSQSEIDAIMQRIGDDLYQATTSSSQSGSTLLEDAGLVPDKSAQSTAVENVPGDTETGALRHDVAFVDSNLTNLQQLVDSLRA